jgi:ferric iron reductase protein FhuF
MKPFREEEITVLQSRYRLTSCSLPSPLSIKGSDLLDEARLNDYLLKVKNKMEAVNLMVAASLFVKRYSFAVLSALYSMSVWNKSLNFSIQNISMETLNDDNQLWLPSFKFHDLSAAPCPEDNRSTWRETVLKNIFRHHVDALFTKIMRVSKLPKLIMWENLYIYILWMYNELLNDQSLSHIHVQIQEDLDYILQTGPGHLFGSYHKNPFIKYDQLPSYDEETGQEVKIRKTCCFAYLTIMKGQHCKTCPVICGRNGTK